MPSVATQPVSSGFAKTAAYDGTTSSTSGTSNTSSTSTSSTSGNSALDMNSFLTMFTTQLKYQDPSNPLESYELAAQLAQFSTVEQLTKINTQLEQQQAILTAINNAQMVDMLGKDLVGTDDSLQLKEGQITKGQYEIDSPASITVKICNDQGQLVRTMSPGPQEAGKHNVQWDGRSDAGEMMGNGTYHFNVEAVDPNGNTVEVKETITGRASALRMEDGIAFFLLDGTDGVKLPISAVIEVDDVPNV